ncbi:Mth938-like domain-containing protein [Microvirgula aerodenitrificans]|uniref:Mth938-like domain-containing protein n=1 Tax=Microvirgula aerodenitrificans TaxID=57480 RepID=UPI00248E2262|nr:Mth938-like domain-containing protein [Microvirgula aerodenitrificans]
MKMHLTQGAQNLFTAYGDGFVAINQEQHHQPLLVMADLLTPWPASSFETLTEDDFAALLAHDPEVVVLGTGPRLRFPHPRLTAALTARQIGVEVMDTPAACRTFNILVSEDRRVLAAILL